MDPAAGIEPCRQCQSLQVGACGGGIAQCHGKHRFDVVGAPNQTELGLFPQQLAGLA
jgi:hypothetical protein